MISLLSGHLGGANRWTREIAGILGAQPVITTATDGRKLPSIDLWASKCGLSIDDIKLAKRVTAYLLKENSESGCLETKESERKSPLRVFLTKNTAGREKERNTPSALQRIFSCSAAKIL